MQILLTLVPVFHIVSNSSIKINKILFSLCVVENLGLIDTCTVSILLKWKSQLKGI